MSPECGPAIPLWSLPPEEEKATKDGRAAKVDSAVGEFLAQCGMGEKDEREDDEAALESIAIASLERRMARHWSGRGRLMRRSRGRETFKTKQTNQKQQQEDITKHKQT